MILKISDDRAAWLAARSCGLGASDASAALGINPWKTPFALWLEKTGQGSELEDSEHLQWGRTLEPVIAAEFAARTGLQIEPADCLIAHPFFDWMLASPDFWVDDCGQRVPLEIKNTSWRGLAEWEAGLADHAHVQLMHQIAVCASTHGYACALVGGNKLFWHRVERDNDLIDQIIEGETKFWELVKTKTPPAMREGDSKRVDEWVDDLTDIETEINESHKNLFELMTQAQAAEKAARAEIDRLQAEIKVLMQGCRSAKCADYRASWSEQTRAGIDTKALAEAHPDIAAKFPSKSEFKRFSIKQITKK